ncbi:MAG: hypothetical protein RL264_1047 [Bacteroidota bacterium]|jgi:hypothetical protein
MSTSIWEATKSLLVVFNYEDMDQLKAFRSSLDKLLNASNVERLLIIVNIPKDVDKATLPPHFLIYYNSPNDYSFFGKLKDIQLENELRKDYDLLIWFGSTEFKIFSWVKKVLLKNKIGVDYNDPFFHLILHPDSIEPASMLEFVTKTLTKIT